MIYQNVPVAKPRPDCIRFIDILMGRRSDLRPPLVEYLVDDVVMKPVLTHLLGREWVSPGADRASRTAYLDNFIEFWHRMGYDFVRLEIGSGFRKYALIAPDATPGSDKQIGWADEHHGAISSWKDFEEYTWPKWEDIDFFSLEYVNNHLPEGMGLLSCHCGGIFEQVSGILSLEGLAFALHDEPRLLEAVIAKVGETMLRFYRHLLDLDRLVAVLQGDDMGFRTGTMIAPRHLRQYFLPWHKRFARMAHEKGLPYFLHSCGQVEAVMDDLIQDIGIDGKHSFEDAIVPVQEFQERYGGRIAVLGGLDVHRLSSHSPQAVKEHTRLLMETCGAKGRYAIGSGNSIPSYVPVGNYLAMVDGALGFNSG